MTSDPVTQKTSNNKYYFIALESYGMIDGNDFSIISHEESNLVLCHRSSARVVRIHLDRHSFQYSIRSIEDLRGTAQRP